MDRVCFFRVRLHISRGNTVLKGLFGISIAAGSSIIADTAILVATPERDRIRGFDEGALIAVTVSAGLGAFFSCALLTSASSASGSVSVMKILFPSVDSWTWRHQLHVTVCLLCLAASHFIVQHEIDRNVFTSSLTRRGSYLRRLVENSPSYLFAVLLLSFAMAALSTLLTLNQSLMLRGGNFTSQARAPTLSTFFLITALLYLISKLYLISNTQVFDFFAALGFAARDRNCRYLWKSHMLFWSIAGFVAGACIGGNAYSPPPLTLLPLLRFKHRIQQVRRHARHLLRRRPNHDAGTAVALRRPSYCSAAAACPCACSEGFEGTVDCRARRRSFRLGCIARSYPRPR